MGERRGNEDPAGRVVLITGAGSGMGAACARLFAADHGGLLLFDVRPDALAAVAGGLGGSDGLVETIAGDVSVPVDAREAVDTCLGAVRAARCAG